MVIADRLFKTVATTGGFPRKNRPAYPFCAHRRARDAECRRKYGAGLVGVPAWVPRTNDGHLPQPWDSCPDHIQLWELRPEIRDMIGNYLMTGFLREEQRERVRVTRGGAPGPHLTRDRTSASDWSDLWPSWARGVGVLLAILPHLILVGSLLTAVALTLG